MFMPKRSYVYVEPKDVIALMVQKKYVALRAGKIPGFTRLRIGPTIGIWEIRGFRPLRYGVESKAMFMPKRSYGHAEPKNAIALSVQ